MCFKLELVFVVFDFVCYIVVGWFIEYICLLVFVFIFQLDINFFNKLWGVWVRLKCFVQIEEFLLCWIVVEDNIDYFLVWVGI